MARLVAPSPSARYHQVRWDILLPFGAWVTTAIPYSVQHHFAKTVPAVRAIYARIQQAVSQIGPFTEDPKKTSIHLVRQTAFAGIATRKSALLLTLKAERDIHSPRVSSREQASKNRWHLVVRLSDPGEVDAELLGWLREAYALAG
jgi:hypothetical protein